MDLSALDQEEIEELNRRTLEDRSVPKLTNGQKKVLVPKYKDFELIMFEGGKYSDMFKCSVKKKTISDSENEVERTVAIKIINIPEDQKKNGVPCSVIRQVSILKELKHPNIVRLLHVYPTEDDVYLTFEHVPLSLNRRISPMFLFNLEELKTFLHQILEGVAYFHSHKIVHRDLRPHNILVDNSLNVKLTDFGAARTFELPLSSYTADVGSRPCYKAPELLFGSTKYSTAIDMWSVGCIFAEMANGNAKLLFNGEHEAQILVQIFSLLGTPTEETWPGLSSVCSFVEVLKPSIKPKNLAKEFPKLKNEPDSIDLLSKMLCMCPERRISAAAALRHEYFLPK